MKVLYHECSDERGNMIPVEFCDGNGMLHVIPAGEPVEFENEWIAKKIVETIPYMGIVEVHFTKTRTGITYDIGDASIRAKKILEVEERKCVFEYIQTQLESRVSRNYPPLPPVGRALSCVIKHKVDLVGQGLRVVGWEPPYEVPAHGPELAAKGAGNEDRIRQLETMMLQQQVLINQLLSGKLSDQRAGIGKKAKEKEVTTEEDLVPSGTTGITVG